MTTANAQIAQHLNIVESAIKEVQEWAHVLFVKFVSGRPRFVSKKVVKVVKQDKDKEMTMNSVIPQSVERAIAAAEKAKTEWSGKPERLQSYVKKLQKLRNSGVDQLKGATATERAVIEAGIRAIDEYLK